jgi:hypothetical protein
MFYFGFAAVWLIIGLTWLRRAYTGEKAGMVMSLREPDQLLMSKRQRWYSTISGSTRIVLSCVYLWLGLRHR